MPNRIWPLPQLPWTQHPLRASSHRLPWRRPLQFALLFILMLLVSGGLGLTPAIPDYDAARADMVRRQFGPPRQAVTHPGVLRSMATVPRHEFVPEALRDAAYEDRPLPIGHGQTISQPYVVAFMTEKLDPRPTDRVLEIGAGSGYQAAVLSGLVAQVFSVEIVAPLAQRAQADLARLGYRNVQVRHGDGYQGWPEAAPFDAVIVTAAPDHVPQPLVDQLKEGGRMIVPVGVAGDQTLYLFTKRAGGLEREAVLPVLFVPMTGPGVERGR